MPRGCGSAFFESSPGGSAVPSAQPWISSLRRCARCSASSRPRRPTFSTMHIYSLVRRYEYIFIPLSKFPTPLTPGSRQAAVPCQDPTDRHHPGMAALQRQQQQQLAEQRRQVYKTQLLATRSDQHVEQAAEYNQRLARKVCACVRVCARVCVLLVLVPASVALPGEPCAEPDLGGGR